MNDLVKAREILRQKVAPAANAKVHTPKVKMGKNEFATFQLLRRVAEQGTQSDFDTFVTKGEIIGPIKLSKKEMETLKGGGIISSLCKIVVDYITHHADEIDSVVVYMRDGAEKIFKDS